MYATYKRCVVVEEVNNRPAVLYDPVSDVAIKNMVLPSKTKNVPFQHRRVCKTSSHDFSLIIFELIRFIHNLSRYDFLLGQKKGST